MNGGIQETSLVAALKMSPLMRRMNRGSKSSKKLLMKSRRLPEIAQDLLPLWLFGRIAFVLFAECDEYYNIYIS